MTERFGHFLAHIFTPSEWTSGVTHSGLGSVAIFYWPIVSRASGRGWGGAGGERCERVLLRAPGLWERHVEAQRELCPTSPRKRSRKTMAPRSHEKVSLCQRVEKQPV